MTELTYPFTAEKVRQLQIGEKVRLYGPLVTGRDRLHKFLFEGGKPPVDLRDGALYHCGPVALRDGAGWRITAAGPTTSMRHEPFMGALIEKHGIRVVIGKGGMGDATRRACERHGCVYLHAVGGAAAVLAACVESVNGVHLLKEFGSAEAMWSLSVKGLEAVVTIDAHGASYHDKIREQSKAVFDALLAGA